MKIYIYIFFALACAVLTSAIFNTVYAHSTQAEGSIHAVLHINPVDDPVALEDSSLQFQFFDDQKMFSLLICECRLDVTHGSSTVQTFTLPTGTLFDRMGARVPIVFPAAGVYTLTVTGSPKTAEFKPFTLVYDIRVENPRQSTGSLMHHVSSSFFQVHGVHLAIYLVGLCVCAIIIFKDKK